MNAVILRFLNSEGGATVIEYVLLASLIAVFVVAVLARVGASLSEVFSEISIGLK